MATRRGRAPHATSGLRLMRPRPAPSDEQILPPRNKKRKGEGGGVSFICSCPEERHPPPPPPPRFAPSPPPGRQRDEGQMGATESALVGSCPPALGTERCSRAELRTSLGGADTSGLLAPAPRSSPPPCLHAVVSAGTELKSTSLSSRCDERGHRAQVHFLVVTPW